MDDFAVAKTISRRGEGRGEGWKEKGRERRSSGWLAKKSPSALVGPCRVVSSCGTLFSALLEEVNCFID